MICSSPSYLKKIYLLFYFLEGGSCLFTFSSWHFHMQQIALQPGKGNEDVRIFVKVDNKEILIGTLSDDKYPHFVTGLIFEKEFELLHTSKTRNISIIGYKYNKLRRQYPLLFLACIFTKRSTSINFCSLTGCPFFIHIQLFY